MKKDCRAFSLTEVIVYIGILIVVSGVFTGVFSSVLKTQIKETKQSEVVSQMNFAVQTIQRAIRSSSIINEDDGCVSTSTLSLTMPEEAKTPTQIYLQNNKVYVQQGTGPAQPITDERVSVDSLEFHKFCNPGSKDTIEIDIAVSALDTSTNNKISKSFHSAVSRVNAVTFDSSILPPTDGTYDVGTWPTLRWRNGAFSGQLKAAQLCIADDCRTSWSSSGITGNGTENAIAKWSSSTNVTSSIIYESSSKIGIGTTTPAYMLDVYGSIRLGTSTASLIFPDGTTQSTAAGSGGWTDGGSSMYQTALTDKIGVGTNSPSARLHLAAGSASANSAPLKFTSGTNLTTPEAGTIEFDGDKFYMTVSDSSPSRKTVSFDYTPAYIGSPYLPNTATGVQTANRAYLITVTVPTRVTMTGIRVRIGTSSGNIDVGLYNNSGTRLASSGSTACPASNTYTTINFSSSATIDPGIYHLAIAADSTSATFDRSGANAVLGVNYFASSFPLPSSLTLPGTADGVRAFSLVGIVSGGITQ